MVKKILIYLLLISSLTSCFEIVERVTLHKDGTGKAVFTLNMSQSKTKLNSIMKMETINGRKVPSKSEIQSKIKNVEAIVRQVSGVSNVKSTLDFENFIGEFSCEFTNVSQLNEVIRAMQSEGLIKKDLSVKSYAYSKENKEFKRIQQINLKPMYNKMTPADQKVLEGAMYTSIFKFDTPIQSYSNQNAKLSKSKTGIMFKSTILDIINQNKTIENTIK